MTDPALYRAHLQTLDRYLADALDRAARKGIKVEQVLFHAGRSTTYHADDQEPATQGPQVRHLHALPHRRQGGEEQQQHHLHQPLLVTRDPSGSMRVTSAGNSRPAIDSVPCSYLPDNAPLPLTYVSPCLRCRA